MTSSSLRGSSFASVDSLCRSTSSFNSEKRQTQNTEAEEPSAKGSIVGDRGWGTRRMEMGLGGWGMGDKKLG